MNYIWSKTFSTSGTYNGGEIISHAKYLRIAVAHLSPFPHEMEVTKLSEALDDSIMNNQLVLVNICL
jgi:hypothetical protein